MSPLEIDDATWEEAVLANPLPVLIDFWAPWCIPCKKVAPLVEDLADRYEGRLAVGKVNADDAPRTVAAYEVLSLPTLLLVVDGEVAARVVGAPKMDRLVAVVEPHLTER
jgi:thioredoxin 1